MKYIRTGSEIYDTDDLYVCEELADKPYATKNGGWCIYKDSIVAQANTIEELCDEFVIADVEHKSWERVFKPALELVIKDYEKPYEIYGAIWTDKGLIYVAKMNSKGDLELL